MKRGFTFAELLIAISIILLIAAFTLPSYQSYSRRDAARSIASSIARTCQERKECAVSLGAFAGICLGQSGYRLYQYHPFSTTSVFLTDFKDLNKIFGMPVTCAISQPSTNSSNPCSLNESNLAFSPQPNSAADWQGTMTVTAQGESWRLTSMNGGFTDGP